MRRNKFSLSNYKLFTLNIGYLVPVNWLPIIPGDKVQQKTKALIRCAPLNAPVMHPVAVRFHHFFVRNRLLWSESASSETDFEAFITGGSDGTKTPTHPYIDLNAATVSEGDLLDYLGVPPANYTGSGLQINALPLRAYAEIYNNYFRDVDLCPELTIDYTDGADSTTNSTLQKVAWPKDPVNIARTSDILGSDIHVPLSGSIPITSDGTGIPKFDGSVAGTAEKLYATGGFDHAKIGVAAATVNGDLSWNDPELVGSLSTLGMDINDLLLSFGLQSFQESRNKFGHRYVDYQRFLGVRPSESMAYMPEYLGGGRQVLQFNEVLSTDGANTGDMKGHGITALQTNRYRREFNEHGILMTVMSVVPKPIYANMLPKKWLQNTKEEYFTKELQFIGDEIITNKEVYSEHSTPDGTFGYAPRYEMYRHEFSEVAGEFNPGAAEDHWHFAISHSGDPSLNQSYVECTPPTDPFQSGGTDQLYCMIGNSIQARRPISKEGGTRLTF